MRQPSAELGSVLVPILAVFDEELAKELWESIETMSDSEAIAVWLDKRSRDLPVASSELITACTTDELNAARSTLAISLRDLNAAIAQLGPPFEQLRNEEGISQAFRYFVLTHREAIRDSLRTAFYSAYRSGADLEAYAACRDLTGLTPDPSWVEDFYEVDDATIHAEVDRWLTELGAPTLVTESAAWPPLDELRRANRADLTEAAARATDLVRAWEQKMGQEPSGCPGEPEGLVEVATAAGILDFEPVNDELVVEWFARTWTLAGGDAAHPPPGRTRTVRGGD